MDFLMLEPAPRWAYNWCFFFAVMGTLVFLTGIFSLFGAKQLGTMLSVFVFLVTMIETATFFTLFWMCRASLQNIQ
jgi:hypothetical protein